MVVTPRKGVTPGCATISVLVEVKLGDGLFSSAKKQLLSYVRAFFAFREQALYVLLVSPSKCQALCFDPPDAKGYPWGKVHASPEMDLNVASIQAFAEVASSPPDGVVVGTYLRGKLVASTKTSQIHLCLPLPDPSDPAADAGRTDAGAGAGGAGAGAGAGGGSGASGKDESLFIKTQASEFGDAECFALEKLHKDEAAERPKVPRVVHVATLDGQSALVLSPFIQGAEEKTTAPWVGQFCDTVAFIHRHGILHLDIRPPNALFAEPSTFLLIDFGRAVPKDRATDVTGAMRPNAYNVRTPRDTDMADESWDWGGVLGTLMALSRPDLASEVKDKRNAEPAELEEFWNKWAEDIDVLKELRGMLNDKKADMCAAIKKAFFCKNK